MDPKYVPHNILDFSKRLANICKRLVNPSNLDVLEIGIFILY